MRIYIVEIASDESFISKISQEGFKTFEAARDWCRNKPGILRELQNGWKFIAEDYIYRIHDILVR